jgi:hypothetical protein
MTPGQRVGGRDGPGVLRPNGTQRARPPSVRLERLISRRLVCWFFGLSWHRSRGVRLVSFCDGAVLASTHHSQPQEPEGWRRLSDLEQHENGTHGRCHSVAHDHEQMPAKSKLSMQRWPCGSCACPPPGERMVSPTGAHRKSVGWVLVPLPSRHTFASDFWRLITGSRARHGRRPLGRPACDCRTRDPEGWRHSLLFDSLSWHLTDGRVLWLALWRTSIWCRHDQVLSRSRTAMLRDGSLARPTLTVSRNHPGLPRTIAFLFLATFAAVPPECHPRSAWRPKVPVMVLSAPQARLCPRPQCPSC